MAGGGGGGTQSYLRTVFPARRLGGNSVFPNMTAGPSGVPVQSRQLTARVQDCQVGLFEAKYDKFGLFYTVGLEIFNKLLSSWPFLKSRLI